VTRGGNSQTGCGLDVELQQTKKMWRDAGQCQNNRAVHGRDVTQGT